MFSRLDEIAPEDRREDIPVEFYRDFRPGEAAEKIFRELRKNPNLSIAELARNLRVNERTVTRSLAKLEQRGWLERIARKSGLPNTYNTFNFPRLVHTRS